MELKNLIHFYCKREAAGAEGTDSFSLRTRKDCSWETRLKERCLVHVLVEVWESGYKISHTQSSVSYQKRLHISSRARTLWRRGLILRDTGSFSPHQLPEGRQMFQG